MDKNKINQSDYLDIVYEGKNKKYGGYELRRNYTKRLLVGSLVAFLVLGGVFASTLIEPKEVVEEVTLTNSEVNLANIDVEPPELKPDAPPPPKPPTVPPPPKPTFKLTPPVIEKNQNVRKEDKITDLEEREENSLAGTEVNIGPDTDPDGVDPGFAFGTGDGDPTPAPAPVEPTKPKGPERQVDKQAIPPIDVREFISKNTSYPEMMSAEGKSGVVTVQFVVKTNGSISDIKVMRSPDKLFSNEAIRVVKLLQNQGKWTPGEKGGKPVDSYYTLPVRFQLR